MPSGFRNAVLSADNVDFTGATITTPQVTADGEILIGSAVAPNIRVGTLASAGGTIAITTGSGTINLESAAAIPTKFNTDAGQAIPAAGILRINGGDNVSTSGALNVVTVRVSGTTDHTVQVGNGTGSLTSIAAGTTGQLLVGATGANPAFGSIAYGDFSFSNLTAATPRSLNVSNVDANAASTSDVRISVAPAGGDGMVSWEVQGTGFYSAGVDNSVAGDPWVLSNSSSPSGGNPLISSTSTGVLTLFNDLDVTEGGTGVSTLTSHGILMGNGAGDIQATGEPGNGQILIGKTGDFPQLAGLTPGPGIAITSGAGTITVGAIGGGLSWTTKAANDNFVVNNGYIAIAPGGALVFTLPSLSSVGSMIGITLDGATSFGIAQGATQTVRIGGAVTTGGAGTKVVSTSIGDTLLLLCTVAGTGIGDGAWNAVSAIGNFTMT